MSNRDPLVFQVDPEKFANLSRLFHEQQVFTGDDKHLVWCMFASFIARTQMGSAAARVLTLVARRLYPEFDGVMVKWQEWGWSTPGGDIRYDTGLEQPEEGT